jgi:hypothetical protein
MARALSMYQMTPESPPNVTVMLVGDALALMRWSNVSRRRWRCCRHCQGRLSPYTWFWGTHRCDRMWALSNP